MVFGYIFRFCVVYLTNVSSLKLSMCSARREEQECSIYFGNRCRFLRQLLPCLSSKVLHSAHDHQPIEQGGERLGERKDDEELGAKHE